APPPCGSRPAGGASVSWAGPRRNCAHGRSDRRHPAPEKKTRRRREISALPASHCGCRPTFRRPTRSRNPRFEACSLTNVILSHSDTVVTTLDTGLWLTVGSLATFASCSSYCGSDCTGALARSEERRVGKEWRSRWWRDQLNI